jgi:hypothetical protein
VGVKFEIRAAAQVDTFAVPEQDGAPGMVVFTKEGLVPVVFVP